MTGAASPTATQTAASAGAGSGWPGVIALTVGIFTLVTSEFLPASLLPLMARDFGITEGLAGQVVTATALVGMIAAPGVGLLFPRLDRRRLLIGLLAVALLSNLLTALAPSFPLVVVARLALGASVAGTWSMALAVVAHLVPAGHLGRAMSVVNIGVAGATVAAVPLGALLSSFVGWRSVFFAVSAATLVAVILFAFVMPSVPAATGTGLRTLLAVARSRVMIVGLIGLSILAAGHFGSYTYIRTAAEAVPGTTPANIAVLLAVYGVGGLLGNLLCGFVVDRHFGVALAVVPLIMAASIIGLSQSTGSAILVFVAVAVWGAGFGAVPTLTQTWVARAEPHRVEAAGGLYVATFQFAISVGVALGGLLLDTAGVGTVYLTGGIAVVVGGMLMLSTRRRLSS